MLAKLCRGPLLATLLVVGGLLPGCGDSSEEKASSASSNKSAKSEAGGNRSRKPAPESSSAPRSSLAQLEAIEKFAGTGLGRQRMVEIFREWGKLDGPAALRFAFANRNERRFAGSMGAALKAWIGEDANEAKDWIEERSRTSGSIGGEIFARAMFDALESEAITEQAEWAARFAGGNDDPGSILVARLASRWGKSDGSAALDWLSTLPDGPARSRAVAAVYKNWTKADPVAASARLNNEPPGELRNIAIRTMVYTIYDEDPEAAEAWVREIAGDDLREQTMHTLQVISSGTGKTPRPPSL